MKDFLVGAASGLVGSLGTLLIFGMALASRITAVETTQADLREWMARIEAKLDRVIERESRRNE